MALGKPFMFVGPLRDRTIFARLGLRVDTDERALRVFERLLINGLAVRQIIGIDLFAVYSRLREYRQKGMTFDAERTEAQLKRELAALDRMQAACGQL